MSDENNTDNPYQPPAPSDEPLVKKEAASPNAELNRVHWLLPILGYAYVPIVLVLMSIQSDDVEFFELSFVAAFFGIPFYAAVLFGLNRKRNEQGTNTPGLKFYHGLSLILPILWVAFILFAGASGAFM